MLTPKEFKELLAVDTETRASIDQEREQRTRECNVGAGMVQCSSCNGWFYDTPGNFCSFCN